MVLVVSTLGVQCYGYKLTLYSDIKHSNPKDEDVSFDIRAEYRTRIPVYPPLFISSFGLVRAKQNVKPQYNDVILEKSLSTMNMEEENY